MSFRRRKGTATPMGLWLDAVQTGLATTTVLSVRLPQLISGTMSRAEARRMVGEKAVAGMQAAGSGGATLARMMRRKPRPVSPFGLMQDALRLAGSIAGPTHRKVTANAKRLSAKRPRKRR